MKEELMKLRDEIDRVDQQLLPLILQRMEIITRVADVKKAADLPVCDPAREKEILNRVEQKAGKAYGAYAREIYKKILEMSRKYQTERQTRHED